MTASVVAKKLHPKIKGTELVKELDVYEHKVHRVEEISYHDHHIFYYAPSWYECSIS